ncbi:UDP-N-acetylglucosamine pyrophosphorylase [Tupanvirus deep ocean]|uniref:UDP-N-acetylglucosamine pyrophosphorylase n=2 Tax=Tupanvirus TaxID=2094720 RepID=A0AC62A8G7_9VIRU|nr:UDP-N-acetylglucosamine pyrophosphorylase [Tupanvirus deep ocean]QKU34044.1 UDP-N-acetylglucosamine pyrophosphorylase [Tupanvirus deep ocean]
MDIIESFLLADNKYTFNKTIGDASKKEFYKINGNKLILVKISKIVGLYDEYFDQSFLNYSQYDYFLKSFQFLKKQIGFVPKIMAHDDVNGIVVMEYISSTRLKEYLEKSMDHKYIKASIDWLVKLQYCGTNTNSIINLRNYGIDAMKKEIKLFLNYGLKYANANDKQIFTNEIDIILEFINDSKQSLNHRDYQPRNIMINDGYIYVIDTQDLCIGPYFCDISAFMFNSSIIFSNDEKEKYAKYFYDKINSSDSFDVFNKKFWLYGLIRILKSYGNHLKYYRDNNRILSLDLTEKNKILLDQINDQVGNSKLYNILNKHKLVPIILAAGKGTRMNSHLPKTLCEINNKPMIFYILDTLTKLNPYKIIIVVGHKKEQIMKKIKEYPYQNIEFVEQTEQLGTGHAVMQCESIMNNFNGQTLVVFGDKPLINLVDIEQMLTEYYANDFDVSFISYNDIWSYQKPGRVIRTDDNSIQEIYEDPNEKFPSSEYISGIQLYNNKKLYKHIHHISNINNKKEYYLADVIKIIKKNNGKIGNYMTNNKESMLNVNTPNDLSLAEQLISKIVF